ncbi:ArsR/SmtB family transcription factor [Bordetella tumulicola]|uniref:ArsR/SmtB family transcription factor n=1 Tax=Bordetella tumulicola TaxID=1649133 RepID=UPI0039EFE052
METSNAVAALAALAQESRLAVFRLLIQAGPTGMAAGKISEAAGIPPSSLSFHLKELAHADMVTSRQEGRFVIYAANFSTAADLVAFLTENCCDGQACDLPCTTDAAKVPA